MASINLRVVGEVFRWFSGF